MKVLKLTFLIAVSVLLPIILFTGFSIHPGKTGTSVRKIRDIIIYEDPMFYASFPSVVRRPSGEFITAFSRAPDRRIFGEEGTRYIAGTILEIDCKE